MSSEAAAPRRKKNTIESTPAPDGDHRKRRRNRTTQSCLNCHTSKRMCDRKRPACARCTQLGLSGLCVYEVDDPNQQINSEDESSRLLKRVAELEGVIRELKNKPHPRWVQSANSGDSFDKWHEARHHGNGGDETSPSNAPSPPGSSASSDKGSRSPPFSPSSPLNRSSPGLMTPTEEYAFSPVGVANQGSIPDYDLASMLLNSYPGIMGNDTSFSPLEHMCGKQTGHCGCIHDSTNYKNMLELSVRLRKASDVLNRSPTHQLGSFCPLHQRISELDSFTTNVLSDISESPLSDNFHPSMQSYHALQSFSHRMAPGTRGPIPDRPWDTLSSNLRSLTALDDSFMTWEPPRRS